MGVRMHLLLAAASLIAATPVAGWSCALGTSGLTLDVIETAPYSYSVSQAGGGVWLSSGSLAIFSEGVEFAANSSGLIPSGPAMSGTGIDAFLGSFSFFSVAWLAGTTPPLPVLANFTCYAYGGGIAVFELGFPAGLPNASTVPPPHQGNYQAGGNAFPSTRFPLFAAGPSDAVSNPAIRFVEYAGVMSSQVSSLVVI